MKVLFNWLKEFVDIKATPAEVRARLSLSGTAVDALEETPSGPLYDVEVTANRADCLGHLGLAREVATLYRVPLKPLHPKLKEAAESASKITRVEIECPDLCGRFTARIIRRVKVAPSPDWLRQRLEVLGQKCINNVVDATNYVMFELGRPLHAFDFDTLKEHRIVVRRGRPGEKLRTLDGAERSLSPEMCIVADAARAISIGGIMGGADTEISSATKTVLLECAWFDPISIRRTAKALGLRTEASIRFERGADIEIADLASQRCAELIQQLTGGEILAGVVDAYPGKEPPLEIELTRKELLRVIGADVPDRDIEESLGSLGFHPRRVDANRGRSGSLVAAWQCKRPPWRRDVNHEIDLIEEVARHYGYDKFPPRLPVAKVPAARLPHAAAENRLRERLVALGYQEIVTIPLIAPHDEALFRPEGTTPSVATNPLSEDASVLRTSGVPNMLATLERNVNRGQKNLRLFEIGKSYEMREGKPVETRILTLGATGLARDKTIYEEAREFMFADLKGDLDGVGELARGFDWRPGGPDWLIANRAAQIRLASEPQTKLGVAGAISRRAAETFKLRQEVFVAELRLDSFLAASEATRAAWCYRPLPRFPAVERDFSLLLAEGTTFREVAEAVRAVGIEALEHIEPVDIYRNAHVAAGKYSLLIRCRFQSAQSTLTEAQLADFSRRIVSALEEKLGAKLRAN